MKAIPASRQLLWVVLALPGLWICYRWAAAPDAYGYGHAIGDSGDWAAWLLMLTLAITPVRLLFRGRIWSAWLVRRRRDSAWSCSMRGHTSLSADRLPRRHPVRWTFRYPVGWLALALLSFSGDLPRHRDRALGRREAPAPAVYPAGSLLPALGLASSADTAISTLRLPRSTLRIALHSRQRLT